MGLLDNLREDIFSLNGRIALVTGGGGGLGRAIVLGLALFGANVVIIDMDEKKSSTVVEEALSLGRDAVFFLGDVTRREDIEGVVRKTIEKFGKIDILVNAAGITRRSTAEEMSERDWDDVINVNLKGTFLSCQIVGREMIKRCKGSIINIASVVGQRGLYHRMDLAVSYCASKGGVIQLTRALSAEWADYGIRVNAIAPTYFWTDMTKPLLENPAFSEYLKWKIPLKRPGNIEEIVGPVVFLASDASSMVTGHILNVDGGWTAI